MTNHDSESQKQSGGRTRTDTNQQDITNRSEQTSGVTPTAINELHRRVLATDDAIGDAERQLTVIADLSERDDDQPDDLLAELQALHQQLEETQNRLHRSLDGVDELLEATGREPACEDTSSSDTPDTDAGDKGRLALTLLTKNTLGIESRQRVNYESSSGSISCSEESVAGNVTSR